MQRFFFPAAEHGLADRETSTKPFVALVFSRWLRHGLTLQMIGNISHFCYYTLMPHCIRIPSKHLIRMIVLLTRQLNASQLLNPEILVCSLCSHSLTAAKVLIISRMYHHASSSHQVCNHSGWPAALAAFEPFPLLPSFPAPPASDLNMLAKTGSRTLFPL